MRLREDEKLILSAGVFHVAILALLALAVLATAGCSRDAVPQFVTLTEPEPPAECNPGDPVVQKVKADLEGGWASDAVAARVSEGWRVAYNNAQGARVTCWMRLQAQRGGKPPSS